jgi:hypothetical protein
MGQCKHISCRHIIGKQQKRNEKAEAAESQKHSRFLLPLSSFCSPPACLRIQSINGILDHRITAAVM